MAELLVLSLPFAVMGWLTRRPLLALAFPFLFWLAFAALETIDMLPGTTSLGSALVAGAVGAIFAGLGIAARSRLRPHPA
jgi:hypothetical protein